MLAKRLDPAVAGSAPIFAALGDDTRLRLVSRLAAGEPLSITALASGAAVTRQAITKHLLVLEDAGLIQSTRNGRERLWELQPKRLMAARRALDLIDRQWGSALARLKNFVERE